MPSSRQKFERSCQGWENIISWILKATNYSHVFWFIKINSKPKQTVNWKNSPQRDRIVKVIQPDSKQSKKLC